MQKRNILETPRLQEIRKQKNKILFNKTLFFCLFLVVLFVILIFVSKINKLEIQKIEVRNTKLLDQESIEKEIGDLVYKKTIFFSKRNVFLYPEKKIEHILYSNPRIEKVSIYREDFTTLVIDIKERGNKYIWCGEAFSIEEMSDINQECFFVSEEGYVMNSAPYFSGDIYLKLFGTLEKKQDTDKKIEYDMFLPDKFQDIIYMYDNLKTLNISPFVFENKNKKEAIFYLTPQKNTKNLPRIIFNQDSDWHQILLNIESVFNTEKFANSFKTDYNSFQYLDMRYGNKIYYKFGEDTPPPAIDKKIENENVEIPLPEIPAEETINEITNDE